MIISFPLETDFIYQRGGPSNLPNCQQRPIILFKHGIVDRLGGGESLIWCEKSPLRVEVDRTRFRNSCRSRAPSRSSGVILSCCRKCSPTIQSQKFRGNVPGQRNR